MLKRFRLLGNQKFVLLVGLALILALVASACGGGATEEAPPAEEPAAEEPAAEELAEPKTLIVAVAALPVTADREFAPGQESVEIIQNTYAHYVDYGLLEAGGIRVEDTSGEGAMVPGIAESWDISDDGTVYTLNLRQGVMSQYGNEFTAECGKYVFDRGFANGAIVAYINGVLNIPGPDSVEVIDKYTLQITLPAPNPIFLRTLNVYTSSPTDCVEAQANATDDDPWANDWFDRNHPGFGPYTVETWNPGDQLILVANPNWIGDTPDIERVIYKEVPDSSSRLALLLNGEVHIAQNLTQRQLVEAEAADGVNVIAVANNQFLFVAMNANEGPTADVRVRQALSYATPYGDIHNSVYNGNASQAYGTVTEGYASFTGDQYWDYATDLDKARELLADAGYADGFESSILINADVQEQEEIAVLLQDAFADIGVTLTIDKRPAAAYTDQKFSGDIELNLDQSYALVMDIGYHTATWLSFPNPLNVGAWQNDEFDGLLATNASIPDGPERDEQLSRMEQIVIEDAPHIFVGQVPTSYGMLDSVSGYVWRTHNQIRFSDLTLDE